jgi:hypothetical protein
MPPTDDLTPSDRAELAEYVREAIEAERYPMAPRVLRIKALLAKLDPAAVPERQPLRPPLSGGPTLQRKRGRR